MNDLISRQQAIDALEEQLDYLQMLNKDENPKAESKWYGVNWARNTIADLPSIQPEIIYCKNCKHHWTYKSMDSMPIEICDLEQTFYDAEHDFCSLAERREDG